MQPMPVGGPAQGQVMNVIQGAPGTYPQQMYMMPVQGQPMVQTQPMVYPIQATGYPTQPVMYQAQPMVQGQVMVQQAPVAGGTAGQPGLGPVNVQSQPPMPSVENPPLAPAAPPAYSSAQ